MGLTPSEQATLHFYQWEHRNRGYQLFNTPVDIEPPYLPYFRKRVSNPQVIDDGRVPSLFQTIEKYFSPTKSQEEILESFNLPPTFLSIEEVPKYVGVLVTFPRGQEILPERNMEFLNMLSYTELPVSFEIIGTQEKIWVQLVCSENDRGRVLNLLKAYFTAVITKDIEVESFGFNPALEIAIADFGIDEEFMRPIYQTNSFSIDPLTSIIANMEGLKTEEIILFQILFKGITSPLAKDIRFSVDDGKGGSFFSDAPEMPKCAQDKTSLPLFSVVIRVAVQGLNVKRTNDLAKEIIRSITAVSASEYNKLIPLSNEGYDYDFHLYNVHHRLSNRMGFILNGKELNTFVHYPNKTLVNAKLGMSDAKTKRMEQKESDGISIGLNSHNGEEIPVLLNTERRLSHTHVIGATGVGKSTLLANMFLSDVSDGSGCALFDPHGDIVEDVLARIPKHRKDDVIIIDPSDIDFPVGFNLLQANSEAEKIVLSSDIVSAFKRHATAWGDNMTAVLQNAVNTILESSNGGTLIELKKLLVEDTFRRKFLNTVEDPSLHYYWKQEYPLVRKGIAPLLTRIDTFLRPKIIRYMLAQKSGVDFKACMEDNKILLIKLSQGLIGEENSHLLGSLFLAKLNQVAMSRQALSKDERKPYFLYLDEFQNCITPSISSILSGARKYGLGLILAHQELSQIEDTKLLNSLLSNPYYRICFRLGDSDAKRLESGFSYFEAEDFMALSRGEAIMRAGSSTNDFNVATYPLPENTDLNVAEEIKQNTRDRYSTPLKKVEEWLYAMLETHKVVNDDIEVLDTKENIKTLEKPEAEPEINQNQITKELREELIERENESVELRAHTYLQSVIKKLGQERNFIASLEYPTKDGGRIDIVLQRDNLKIGFEISETNKPVYEVNNIMKCLKDGCVPVIVVSKSRNHLDSIAQLAHSKLSKKDMGLVKFILPDQISSILDDLMETPKKHEEVIKGFRIVTEFEDGNTNESNSIKSQLARLFRGKK